MLIRSLVAACCAVTVLAVPAQAQTGCTTDFVRDLFTTSDPGDPPYPIVQIDPDGTVHVYPQNVVPGAQYSAGQLVQSAGVLVAQVGAYVDCVV